jgi:sRNA-binding carbon storage regulator CsrA
VGVTHAVRDGVNVQESLDILRKELLPKLREDPIKKHVKG